MKKINTYWCALNNFFIKIFFVLNIYTCNNFLIKQVFDGFFLIILSMILTIIEVFTINFIIKRCSKEIWNKVNFIIDKINKNSFVVLFIIPFIIKIICIFVFKIDAEGDIGVYVNIAKDIVNNGAVVNAHNASYSLSFPHLFWFGVLLIPPALFGGKYEFFCIYVALLQCLSNFLLYKAIKNFYKESELENKISVIIPIIYTFLPSQLISCLCVTHEVGFNFLLILLIFIMSLKVNEKFYFLKFFATILTLFMLKQVNSMGIIVIIALILNTIIMNKFTIKQLTKFGLIACIIFIIFSNLSISIQSDLTCGNEVPSKSSYWWSLYVGADEETGGRLLYNHPDFMEEFAINEYGENYSIAQMNDVEKKYAIERWQILVRNPLILIKHLINKFKNVWSGTHYSIEYVSVFINGFNKYILYGLVVLNNLIYILLANLCLACMDKNNGENNDLYFLKTMLIGNVCVLLLTEVMNKYNLTSIIPITYIIGLNIANHLCLCKIND